MDLGADAASHPALSPSRLYFSEEVLSWSAVPVKEKQRNGDGGCPALNTNKQTNKDLVEEKVLRLPPHLLFLITASLEKMLSS